jgi:thiol-disulfide isomerase/thioredoxin
MHLVHRATPADRAIGGARFARRTFGWLLALALVPTAAFAQTADAPGGPTPRKVDEIQKDLFETKQAAAEVMPSMDALLDPAKRAEVAPKALPPIRKMSRLLDEYALAMPEAKAQIHRAVLELRAVMALLGDPQADDEIRKLTVSKDEGEAVDAKSWWVVVRWVRAQKDTAAQEKLAAELTKLAQTQPQNAMIAQVGLLMTDSAATPALGEQIEQLVARQLKSPEAEQIAQVMAGKRKLRSLEGQPLVIEGVQPDGRKFSTASWKGKVVLVDFWATWCGPCMAEMPSVKKAYADHHTKGLEIIGVSCDRDVEELKAFQAKNPDAPWPQLFDPSKPGWHPLAEQFGVSGIPTMFLIDRKGTVRTVKGRESYQELIPKLLGEKE